MKKIVKEHFWIAVEQFSSPKISVNLERYTFFKLAFFTYNFDYFLPREAEQRLQLNPPFSQKTE
jgi:hypothetical protein